MFKPSAVDRTRTVTHSWTLTEEAMLSPALTLTTWRTSLSTPWLVCCTYGSQPNASNAWNFLHLSTPQRHLSLCDVKFELTFCTSGRKMSHRVRVTRFNGLNESETPTSTIPAFIRLVESHYVTTG